MCKEPGLAVVQINVLRELGVAGVFAKKMSEKLSAPGQRFKRGNAVPGDI